MKKNDNGKNRPTAVLITLIVILIIIIAVQGRMIWVLKENNRLEAIAEECIKPNSKCLDQCDSVPYVEERWNQCYDACEKAYDDCFEQGRQS